MKEIKFIDSDKLSKAVKDFLLGLAKKGRDVAEITAFHGEFRRIVEGLPAESAVEWCDAEIELPAVSDEYLVMIAGAKEPTVLNYDAEDQVFFEERIDLEDDVIYKVTHWAEMPGGPDV